MRTFHELLLRWQAAEAVGDRAALDELLDGGFLGDGPDGQVLDKRRWVDGRRPALAYSGFTARRVAADVVVATGLASAVGCTLVAVLGPAGWRIVNLQLGIDHLADVPDAPLRDAHFVRHPTKETAMRKIIESTFVTLDGVISEPEKWGPPYWDDEHHGYAARLISRADALLLGRETYQTFAEVWPHMSNEYADRMNALPKHVASRTLTDTTWNATVLDGDTAEAVAALRQQDGQDLLKFGTGELDHTLLAHDLLDELHLWIFPVIVGAGARLLDGQGVTNFELADVTRFKSGIAVHVYRPTKQ